MSCYVCQNDPAGCERCRGGPGEQGLAHDEKQLMQLRDRVRQLEAGLQEAAAALEYEDAVLEASRARKVLRGAA